jgi:nucleotide-binding universal stress UspA family protein
VTWFTIRPHVEPATWECAWMSDRPPARGTPARRARPAKAVEPTPAAGSDPGRHPASIVVGVDGSECSLRAVAYAAGLARRQSAMLVAVYVRRSPSGFAYLANTPGALAAVVEAESTTESRIRDEIAEECDAAGIEGTLVVRTGSATRALCMIAHEWQAHAVIVGARPGMLGKFFPSGRRHLLSRAGRPVVLVP